MCLTFTTAPEGSTPQTSVASANHSAAFCVDTNNHQQVATVYNHIRLPGFLIIKDFRLKYST